MKVKIQNRSVYHKFAEVEIEIPDLIDGTTEVHEWLMENEHTYIYEMDEAINEAEYKFGSGEGEYEGMDEKEESEWRFECKEIELGGHL